MTGRVVVAGLLAALAPVTLGAPPAGAHASLVAQFPTDGQILDPAAVPTSVAYEFNEQMAVDPAGLAIRDAAGAVLSGAAAVAADNPNTATVASSAPLAAGRYALETSVTSADGHQLVHAYGFAVGPEPGPAAPAAVPVDLAAVESGQSPITVVVDGSTAGARTVSVPAPDGVTGGEVRLTCRRGPGERIAKVRAPFRWRLNPPQGGIATAAGYLPVPCTYTIRVVLERAFPASPSSYVAAPDKGFSIS